MKTDNFSFELPEELIAQHPADERGRSRLMELRKGAQTHDEIRHRRITDLPGLIPEDSVLVLNDSKVRKARIFGETGHGGNVEFLLLEERADGEWKALASKAKRQKPGREYVFPGSIGGKRVTGRITGVAGTEGEHRYIRFSPAIDDEYLERHGHMPLPPYIRREDTADDAQRYQTVYADRPGSVAAPTAGLHLTDEIIEQLEEKGIRIARVTLHVGLGTFTPIRSVEVEEHRMHYERYSVPPHTSREVTRAITEGRPVYAVGTTSVRTLESAWDDEHGELSSGEGATNLYVYPGYRFRVVDGLLTNFHTPKSSLIVMVAAFAGKERIDRAYRTAIGERYRFFSYGDAMLIH